jgi:ankyrin repeat protein
LAEKGQHELAKILLDQFTSGARKDDLLKAVVLTEVEGQRPRHLASIHLAALKGHTKLVELFLDSGIDVNLTNNKNDTPVLWAARGNHIDTVRLLISRGANLQLENDKGSTPLYWAVRYGFAELARLLVGEGQANVHQRRKLGLVTPIILASALGHRDIVDVLLAYGADVEARMGNGTTALHAAAFEVHLSDR